jgi:glycosyltransferase involved in cell wall biosynthesis
MFKKIDNIFLVYYGSFNAKSGSNIHILELLGNLKKHVNVVMFVPGQRYVNCAVSGVKYVPVIDNKYLVQPSYELMLSFYLLYFCIVNRPDVLYLRQNSFPLFPIILCKFLKISSVVEVNGLVQDELKVNNSKSFPYKIFSFLSSHSEKLNYRYCDRIVSVTEKLRDELVNQYAIPKDKVFVVNNGANIELFKPINQEQAKAELGLDKSKKYVCFVGSLAAWQGVEFLIYAAPFILEKNPNVRFLIVGDGAMKHKLLEITSKLGLMDKFIFTGSVPYENVPLYINAADICVVPKKPIKSGYSPLKLYECMACGKPVIATKTSGFELLEEINAGILINPENYSEFANSILMLLNNPKLMTSMGMNGRRYVTVNHSWSKVASKVLNICNSVLEDTA